MENKRQQAEAIRWAAWLLSFHEEMTTHRGLTVALTMSEFDKNI